MKISQTTTWTTSTKPQKPRNSGAPRVCVNYPSEKFWLWRQGTSAPTLFVRGGGREGNKVSARREEYVIYIYLAGNRARNGMAIIVAFKIILYVIIIIITLGTGFQLFHSIMILWPYWSVSFNYFIYHFVILRTFVRFETMIRPRTELKKSLDIFWRQLERKRSEE